MTSALPSRMPQPVVGDCDLCGSWASTLDGGLCPSCAYLFSVKQARPHLVATTETASGQCVDLLNPDPATINIKDIAHHLSRQCRFNGATRGEYGLSVAEHSVWVARYLLARSTALNDTPDRQTALYGLLHDAAEAWIGDFISPIKRIPAIKSVIDPIERGLMHAVYAALDLDPPCARAEEDVYAADMQALSAEAKRLIHSGGYGPDWAGLRAIDPISQHLMDGAGGCGPLPPGMAEAMFLIEFRELAG